MNGRNYFIEYIFDLKPPAERLKDAKFDVQAKTMLNELDAFRSEFGKD